MGRYKGYFKLHRTHPHTTYRWVLAGLLPDLQVKETSYGLQPFQLLARQGRGGPGQESEAGPAGSFLDNVENTSSSDSESKEELNSSEEFAFCI